MKELKDFIYYYLHSKVARFVVDDGKLMSNHEVEWRLSQGWGIPKKLCPAIIDVWEQLTLIRKIDRFTIEFNKPQFDEDDLRELCILRGIV